MGLRWNAAPEDSVRHESRLLPLYLRSGALKFCCSVRLDIRRKKAIKHGEESIGSEVKVVKNKLAPPFREAEFEILYGSGVNKPRELVDTAEKLGLLERSRPGTRKAGRRSAKAATRCWPASTSTRRCSSGCVWRWSHRREQLRAARRRWRLANPMSGHRRRRTSTQTTRFTWVTLCSSL
jgi:hypothetical protein